MGDGDDPDPLSVVGVGNRHHIRELIFLIDIPLRLVFGAHGFWTGPTPLDWSVVVEGLEQGRMAI